ncbi:unnamed protein product [Blepharisma stoltei]|uniref:UBC core domain-containing protein n=1 Tax=Blepharisma stoltei TaxID=1481888 RepID=A0AAU9INT2_9CILI|nr:unnamed protein product [Blepharisma stoltei]CAG9324189.1 unnamed protein product [Blepharisma stoltei]
MQRLMDEFINLQDRPEPYITINIINHSFYNWKGTLNGPDGTPYEGGLFEFEITFPPNFPTSPPEFLFKTPIFHPNIRSDGHVCCEIFSNAWNPKVPVRNIISYAVGLLNEPEPRAGYQGPATELCLKNREDFNREARRWTFEHAMG